MRCVPRHGAIAGEWKSDCWEGEGEGGMQLSTVKEEEGISDGGRGRTRHGLGSGGAAMGDVARE